MTAREELNEAKNALHLSSDKQLADLLKISKGNIDSWVRRNRVPDKWKMIISHHVHPLAKLPLGDEDALEKIVKANPAGLPGDIQNVVDIMQGFDGKQRREVLQFVWALEDELGK